MRTACDVAAITKPWKIQKEIAQLVTAEFFEQGDIEKVQLGEKPIVSYMIYVSYLLVDICGSYLDDLSLDIHF